MVPLLILFASKSIYFKVVLVITQKCLDKYTLALFCHQSSIIAWLQTKPVQVMVQLFTKVKIYELKVDLISMTPFS